MPEQQRLEGLFATGFVALQEVIYVFFFGELAYLAFLYLASWQIFRVVAYILCAIVWSNFAGQALSAYRKALHTHTETVQQQIPDAPPPAMSILDTDVFLEALRQGRP